MEDAVKAPQEEIEDFMQTPPTSYLKIWIRVAIAGMLSFFCAGLIFGYNALKPIMIDEGIYANYCQNNTIIANQTIITCLAQEEKLDYMFATTVGLLGVFSYGIGLLQDALGRRVVMVTSGLVLSISCVIFAFSNSVNFDAFIPSLLFISLAGMGVYFSSLTYGVEIPNWGGFIIGLMSASWDVSALIPYFFNILHFQAGLSLRILMICFSGFGIPICIFGIFMNTKNVQPVKTSEEPKKSLRELFTKENIPQIISYIIPYRDMMHAELLAMYFFGVCSIIYHNFYIQTLQSQLFWITNYQLSETNIIETQLYVFSILLPVLGPIVAIVIGKVKDYIGLTKSMFSMLPLIATLLFTTLIKSSGLQYLTMIIFVSWRGVFWVFITAYFFDNSFYPMHAAGKLLSLMSLISGILGSFLSPYMESLVLNNLEGNYFVVDLIFMSLTIISCVFMLILTIRKERTLKRTQMLKELTSVHIPTDMRQLDNRTEYQP
jgi:MFS family permease